VTFGEPPPPRPDPVASFAARALNRPTTIPTGRPPYLPRSAASSKVAGEGEE
jgi:hypothetical protein